MFRPGGMSSDEDEDEYEFSSSFRARSTYQPPVVPEMSLNDKLIEAAALKDLDKAKDLINQGAEVNYKKDSSWNAILYAAFSGNYEFLKFLIEKGADVNCHHELCTPFLAVCKSDSANEETLIECLDLLLSSGADKDVVDSNRMGAVTHVVRKNHEKMLMKLISLDCDINRPDLDGWSPIFYAVDDGNIHMVSILKDYGAELYRLDKRSRSLIDLAAAKDFRSIVELLTGNKTYFDETVNFELPVRRESSYQILLMELPNPDDRLSGFSMDVYHILRGIGLTHLCKLFYNIDVQLGQLLTADDKQLYQWGVMLSYERKHIISSVKKFHEHPWSTDSFGSTLASQELDLFQIVKGLSTVMRQLYIINLTVHLLDQRSNNSEDEEIDDLLESIQGSACNVNNYLEEIKACGKRLEMDLNPYSPDFIGPLEVKKTNWANYVLLAGTAISIYFFKRRFIS